MTPTRFPLLLAALWAVTSAATAQSVWRCQDGARVVYQSEPCRGGRTIEALTPRPAADEAEAARIAQRQQALADSLSAQRREREAQPVALAAGILHSKTELSPPKKPRLATKHPLELDEGVRIWRAKPPSTRHKPG